MKRKSKELKRKSEETKRKQKEIKENEKKTERKIKEKADEVAAAAVTAAAAAAMAHPFVRSPVCPCPFVRSSIHRPRNLNKFLGLWPIRSSVGLSAHSALLPVRMGATVRKCCLRNVGEPEI